MQTTAIGKDFLAVLYFLHAARTEEEILKRVDKIDATSAYRDDPHSSTAEAFFGP